MSKHEKIVKMALDLLVSREHPLHLGYLGMPMDEVLGDLFHGYRSSSTSGWQLTGEGFMFFGAAFKGFPVKVETPIPLTPRVLVLLDQKAKLPYFLSVRNDILESIDTFDQELALLLTMYGGDIQRALE